MSRESVCDRAQSAGAIREDRSGAWQPLGISDRKLHELQRRLAKVQRLGDAFADIRFSDDLQQRLQRPKGAADA